MLIFIIEDVSVSENIYSDATALYIHTEVEKFKFYLGGFAIACLTMNFIIVFNLIYFVIVVPVKELTD
jgi:hypothetical protein